MSETDRLNTPKKIWVIADNKDADVRIQDLESIGLKQITAPIKEYHISDLAWYLLNPEPIIIQDRLIGCYVTYKKNIVKTILNFFTDSGTKGDKNKKQEKDPMAREYVSMLNMKTYSFRDKNFENHFRKINRAIKPYDSLFRILPKLNTSKIRDITGICEDIAGNRYKLDLQGSVKDKLNYMITNLLSHVRITIKKAYLTKGLFELRGYRFDEYNPDNRHKLIRFFKDGKISFLMISQGGEHSFIIDEPALVYWLQLFEQSLRTNDKLYESLELCIKGEAKPFKLFFTKQLEFSYSQNHLPKIFKNNYDISKMAPEDKSLIAESLNNQQRVISFNYIPHSVSGDEKMHTNISVMHDVRALEALKDHFPNLFNSIFENTPSSDAGRFYLLDSIKGCQDE